MRCLKYFYNTIMFIISANFHVLILYLHSYAWHRIYLFTRNFLNLCFGCSSISQTSENQKSDYFFGNINDPYFQLQVWFELFSKKQIERYSFWKIFFFWKFDCFDVYIKTLLQKQCQSKMVKKLSKIKDTRRCFYLLLDIPFSFLNKRVMYRKRISKNWSVLIKIIFKIDWSSLI